MTNPIRTRGIQPDVPPETPQYKCPVCDARINTRAAYQRAMGPAMTREGYSDKLGYYGCVKCREDSP